MKIPSTFKVEKSDFEDVLKISGYIEPLNSFSIACPTYFEGTILSIVDDGTFVKKGDTVCVLESNVIQTEYDAIATMIANAEMDFEKLKANQAMQMALMEAQLKTNNAENQIAELDSLQLNYNSPVQRKIKELELQKITIQKQRLLKKQSSLQIIQKNEIRRKEFEIARLKNRLETMQKRIDDLTLVSPVDGMALKTLHYVTNRKVLVGDPVWSNMPLLQIPVSDKMKVIINASEGDFKRINEKDSVEYLFDAMPENSAKGIITKKSPVGRPVKQDSKVKVFDIEASVDTYKSLPEPGFTCNCKVILKKQTDVIVVPQIAVFDSDSMKVVYVLKSDHFEKRQVKTGLSSPERVVVSAGLNDGDEITLTVPEKEFIKRVVVFKKSNNNSDSDKIL